jgi:hypothetical protein
MRVQVNRPETEGPAKESDPGLALSAPANSASVASASPLLDGLGLKLASG